MNSIDGTTLTYDIFSNMKTHGSNSYTYDASGQRIRKIENGVKTHYIKSGMQTLAEYDSTGDLAAEYIHGLNGMIAKLHPSEGLRYFYTDHLGSTRELGSTIFQRDYYPFGETMVSAGDETDYQFTGKELDNNTGLYYFGARYYDPGIGRWLTPDPLAQLYPSVSPYVYCGNNPINRIDLFGLDYIPHYDKSGKLIYWEWDEPLLCLGERYGDVLTSIELRNFRNDRSESWLDKHFPLATQNDPWLYRTIRGTGDLRQDMDRFVGGVPALSVATVVTTSGGALTVITYGSTVVGYVTSTGTVIYWGLGQEYITVNTYGSYYLNRFGNAVSTRTIEAINFSKDFYYINKPGIFSLGRGFIDAFSKSIPNIEQTKWWGAGYSTGTAIKRLLGF